MAIAAPCILILLLHSELSHDSEKVAKRKDEGPAYVHVLSVCPSGWGFPAIKR